MSHVNHTGHVFHPTYIYAANGHGPSNGSGHIAMSYSYLGKRADYIFKSITDAFYSDKCHGKDHVVIIAVIFSQV